jgi:hypothetical protein
MLSQARSGVIHKPRIRIGNWINLLHFKPKQFAISLQQLSLPRSLSRHTFHTSGPGRPSNFPASVADARSFQLKFLPSSLTFCRNSATKSRCVSNSHSSFLWRPTQTRSVVHLNSGTGTSAALEGPQRKHTLPQVVFSSLCATMDMYFNKPVTKEFPCWMLREKTSQRSDLLNRYRRNALS